MAAEKLRDLSRPIDVPLLDATVAAFYGTGSSEEVTAPPLNPFNAADVHEVALGLGCLARRPPGADRWERAV
jgi:hypothetical protein